MAFTPRMDAYTPTQIYNNPKWYSSQNIYYPASQMPNCTCYTFGRFWEINGRIVDGLGRGNGEDWWNSTDGSLLVKNSTTPVLGAIACWRHTVGDYYGHVAVVEKIYANGDIETSNSGYQRPLTSPVYNMSKYFWTETCYKDLYGPGRAYLSEWMKTREYRLQGFIYPADIAPVTYDWVYRVSDQASTAALTQAEMENNAIIFYSILTYAGWSLSAICGALGSAQRESTLNPGACELGYGIPVSGSDYYGAGCGLVGLTDYPPYTATYPHPLLWNANREGKDWYDGTFQTEMLTHSTDPVWTQLGTGAQRWGWNMGLNIPDQLSWNDYIVNDYSPERSAYNWFYQFELGMYPDPTGTLPQRQQNARNWYNFLQGVAPVPPPKPPQDKSRMYPWMMVKPYFLRGGRR